MKSYIKIFIIIVISFLINGCKKNKLKHGDYEIKLTGNMNSIVVNQSTSFIESQIIRVINSDKNTIHFYYDYGGKEQQLNKNNSSVKGSITFYASSNNYHGFTVEIDGKLKIKDFRYEIEGSFVGGETEFNGGWGVNPIYNPNYYTGTFVIKHKKKQ